MVSNKALLEGLDLLQAYFPKYATPEASERILRDWKVTFKDVSEESFLFALTSYCKSHTKPPFAEMINYHAKLFDTQKVTQYEKKLAAYLEYKNAEQDKINAWVDFRRVMDETQGWTTSSFKEMQQFTRDQLNEAIRNLPREYRERNNIEEVTQ